MQNHGQFRVRMRIRNQLVCRFANRQLWPLAVMMLRIPIVITRGHPLQVNSGKHAESIRFYVAPFTAVNSQI
jgi:hypothetical protein